MIARAALLLEDHLRIPARVYTWHGFNRWVHSGQFPEEGRFDFLAGNLEVEMSPEDLHTHGTPKIEIAAQLHRLMTERETGEVFVDRTRVVCQEAGLSAEPDVVVVLAESLVEGRVRYTAAGRKGAGRFSEIEGAPDVVVEVISDSSEGKDRDRLPQHYAQAGIPELWLVDARGKDLLFEIYVLAGRGYRLVPPDAEGLQSSRRLQARFRLERRRTAWDSWRYRLEIAPPAMDTGPRQT